VGPPCIRPIDRHYCVDGAPLVRAYVMLVRHPHRAQHRVDLAPPEGVKAVMAGKPRRSAN